MHFVAHTPEAPLDRYIQSMFHYSDFMPEHSIERVVPDGGIYLIFELDGYTRHLFDVKTHEPTHTFTRAWVSGMQKNYMAISAHENSEMFVVQFHPGGASPFLRVPASVTASLPCMKYCAQPTATPLSLTAPQSF